MKAIERYVSRLVGIVMLSCVALSSISQTKFTRATSQRKDFYQLIKEANLDFTLPAGFREIKAVDNEDYSFDYAMEVPGKDFEVWLQVRSQKQNWISYEKASGDKKTELANPDSMYMDMSKAMASTLSVDDNYLVRNMPPEVLARYNADAGKSYLINLTDSRLTKHYKYALIISLQKNHTGTLLAVYFTNDKDADFYRYVYRAGHCLKFKPPLPG